MTRCSTARSPSKRSSCRPTWTRTRADPGADRDIIEIWTVPGNKKVSALPGPDGLQAMELSHDGSRLVTAAGGSGALWDVRSQKQLASWSG